VAFDRLWEEVKKVQRTRYMMLVLVGSLVVAGLPWNAQATCGTVDVHIEGVWWGWTGMEVMQGVRMGNEGY
jgi:hypothetical protein